MHLDGIQSPRIGSINKDEERLAFEARSFVIDSTVGKLIEFNITNTLNQGESSIEFGEVHLPKVHFPKSEDLTTHIIRNGWAKLRNNIDGPLNVVQDLAKIKHRGIWNYDNNLKRNVQFSLAQSNVEKFVHDYKSKTLVGLVEQVRDGSNVKIRLLLSNDNHQYINLSLLGVRSPKIKRDDLIEEGEEFGEQSKLYVESKCLQSIVRVNVVSNNQSLNSLIGFIHLNNGQNLSECIISNGFGKFADWHSALLSSQGPSHIPSLKVAEKFAQKNKLNIWQNYVEEVVDNNTNGINNINNHNSNNNYNSKAMDPHPRQSEVIVSRIWSGDQLSVINLNKDGSEGNEKRIQLSSIRQPRGNDQKSIHFQNEAKEFLRKKLIGKKVIYQHDYTRPKDENFDERECATIRLHSNLQKSLNSLLVEKGFCNVIKHKKDDHKSLEYSQLLILEQNSINESKGIHSNKDLNAINRNIPDASETYSKANSFLNNWKRVGKVNAIVDYVLSGSRFRLYIPKDNQKLTFVLSGIRTPKTVKNNEIYEPFSKESLDYSNRKLLQRDIEILFEGVDKVGSFIGTLLINGENFGINLCKQGLAYVHEPSAQYLNYGEDLFDAEQLAKENRRGIWENYDESENERLAEEEERKLKEKEEKEKESDSMNDLIDIFISDIRSSPFSFSVQMVGSEESKKFETFMKSFATYHQNYKNVDFIPKNGMLVSAKFSQDNQWYRAKIRKSSEVLKTAQVTFIDYGNEEVVNFKDLRLLDEKFKLLKPQATSAKLSFVDLLPLDNDYGHESLDRFKEICDGRNMVAKVDHKDDNGFLHLRVLDPSDPDSAISPEYCVNADLIADGLATIDKRAKCK